MIGMTVQSAKVGSTSVQTVAFAPSAGVQSVGFDGAVAQTVDSTALAKHRWPTFLDDLCRPVTITADLYKRNVLGVGREYYIKDKNGKEIVLTRTIAGQTREDKFELPKLVEAYKKGLIGTSQVQVGNAVEYAKQVARHNARPFIFKFSPEVVTSVYDKDTTRKQAMGQALLRLGMASKNTKGEIVVSIPNNAAGGAAWAKAEGIVNAIPATFLGTGGFEVPRNGGYPLAGKTGSKFTASNEFISARDAQRKEIAIGHWAELGGVAQEIALAMGKSPIKVVGKGVRSPSSVARTEMARDYRNKIAAGADPVVRNIGNVRSPSYTAPDIGAPVKGAGKPNTPPPISAPGGKLGDEPTRITPVSKELARQIIPKKLKAVVDQINFQYSKIRGIVDNIEALNNQNTPMSRRVVNGKIVELEREIKIFKAMSDRLPKNSPLRKNIAIIINELEKQIKTSTRLTNASNAIGSQGQYVSFSPNYVDLIQKFGQLKQLDSKNPNVVKEVVTSLLDLEYKETGHFTRQIKDKIELFLGKSQIALSDKINQAKNDRNTLRVQRLESELSNLIRAKKITQLSSLEITEKPIHEILTERMSLLEPGKKILLITTERNFTSYLKDNGIDMEKVVVHYSNEPTPRAYGNIGNAIARGDIDQKVIGEVVSLGGVVQHEMLRHTTEYLNKAMKFNAPGDARRIESTSIDTNPSNTGAAVGISMVHGVQHSSKDANGQVYTLDTSYLTPSRYTDRVVHSMPQLRKLTGGRSFETYSSGYFDLFARISSSIDVYAAQPNLGRFKGDDGKSLNNRNPLEVLKQVDPQLHRLFIEAKRGNFSKVNPKTGKPEFNDYGVEKLLEFNHRYAYVGVKEGPPINGEHRGFDLAHARAHTEGVTTLSHGNMVGLFTKFQLASWKLLTGEGAALKDYNVVAKQYGMPQTLAELSQVTGGAGKPMDRAFLTNVFMDIKNDKQFYGDKTTYAMQRWLKEAKNKTDLKARINQLIDMVFVPSK
jgi:hypothetical protein